MALVTGASRGIGRATALTLARLGANVAVCATQERGVDLSLAAVRGAGAKAVGTICDVSDPDACSRLVALTERELGPIDLLINNAGIVQREPLEGVTDADFDKVLRVNLSGAFYLARRVIPGMVKRGQGRVINVSSISATLGSPGMISYCASKWGMNGMTKALAAEVDGKGVMVVAVMPGSVDTDMLQGSGFKPKMTDDQVAALIGYLCSQAPLAMNGSLVEMFG
ncbi:MAG: SDR family NAD(P)-dependent oxidoreductase [Myxococcaceae bacterium]